MLISPSRISLTNVRRGYTWVAVAVAVLVVIIRTEGVVATDIMTTAARHHLMTATEIRTVEVATATTREIGTTIVPTMMTTTARAMTATANPTPPLHTVPSALPLVASLISFSHSFTSFCRLFPLYVALISRYITRVKYLNNNSPWTGDRYNELVLGELLKLLSTRMCEMKRSHIVE